MTPCAKKPRPGADALLALLARAASVPSPCVLRHCARSAPNFKPRPKLQAWEGQNAQIIRSLALGWRVLPVSTFLRPILLALATVPMAAIIAPIEVARFSATS